MSTPYTVTVTELPEGMMEIKGEIAWDTFVMFETVAFSRLAAHLELDGFRKGHVPENVARKHLADELVLTDMAELALQEFYPRIIKDHAIDAIGRPEIAITKIARGNTLGFTITTAVIPHIKLPDYKALAKSIALSTPGEVTEEDIDKVIEDLRQIRAYGHVHSTTDTHEHTETLPEVTDEFAQSFGDFSTVADMRIKIKENLLKERERDAKDKRRVEIMESIIKSTDFPIPAIVLKSEQEKMLAQIEADVSRSGMTMEDYLKHAGKTRETIAEEFKPEAEKRARFQLVLNAIARTENIAPTEEEVNAEAQRMVDSYPGADLNRAKAYADMVLTNDKTFRLLEEEK
jgi:FKBP-type peptidyl-prolyl cis-trans isomerase (trigger factor)